MPTMQNAIVAFESYNIGNISDAVHVWRIRGFMKSGSSSVQSSTILSTTHSLNGLSYFLYSHQGLPSSDIKYSILYSILLQPVSLFWGYQFTRQRGAEIHTENSQSCVRCLVYCGDVSQVDCFWSQQIFLQRLDLPRFCYCLGNTKLIRIASNLKSNFILLLR